MQPPPDAGQNTRSGRWVHRQCALRRLPFHGLKGARALLSGVLEIVIKPEKGWFNSSMRKIADDAESAQTNNEATIVRFGRANMPKLTKMIVSQNTSTATNGLGTALSDSAKRTRVCARSIAI